MISFLDCAKKYAASHENPMVRSLHLVAAPLILLSLMILLGLVHVVVRGFLQISLTDIAVVVLLIYYVKFNWRVALALIPIMIILLFIASLFSRNGSNVFILWLFACTFLLGVGLQFIGYFIEGKRPDFIDMLWQLLMAPLCIGAEFLFKLGRMQDLKEAIHGKKNNVSIHH